MTKIQRPGEVVLTLSSANSATIATGAALDTVRVNFRCKIQETFAYLDVLAQQVELNLTRVRDGGPLILGAVFLTTSKREKSLGGELNESENDWVGPLVASDLQDGDYLRLDVTDPGVNAKGICCTVTLMQESDH